jgi:hypothetical protein
MQDKDFRFASRPSPFCFMSPFNLNSLHFKGYRFMDLLLANAIFSYSKPGVVYQLFFSAACAGIPIASWYLAQSSTYRQALLRLLALLVVWNMVASTHCYGASLSYQSHLGVWNYLPIVLTILCTVKIMELLRFKLYYDDKHNRNESRFNTSTTQFWVAIAGLLVALTLLQLHQYLVQVPNGLWFFVAEWLRWFKYPRFDSTGGEFRSLIFLCSAYFFASSVALLNYREKESLRWALFAGGLFVFWLLICVFDASQYMRNYNHRFLLYELPKLAREVAFYTAWLLWVRTRGYRIGIVKTI